jgi:hypothetical protein
MSVELSLEDVKRVALHYGFQFEVMMVSYIYSVLFVSVNDSKCMDCRRRRPLRQPTLQILDQ